MYSFVCKQCGKVFENKKQDKKFCCFECYQEYLKTHHPLKKIYENDNINNNKVKVKCLTCGKEEWVSKKRAEKYKCCSVKCLSEYNRQKYSQKVTKVCPICKKTFEVKPSSSKRRICCSLECSKIYRSQVNKGDDNPNSLVSRLRKNSIAIDEAYRKEWHQAIIKKILKVKKIPKGYHIHHKDTNHRNNDPQNLVVLPNNIHMLIHRIFGNVLLNALHTGRITEETFFQICNEEYGEFYRQIIHLNVTNQAVVKQGELLENHEDDNQQPSIYRNIIEGSTTNNRVLPFKDEDSNVDTSALPLLIDIANRVKI